ncbi:Tetratricopeptide repeat-containing protein [Fodinibius sediminis]|uniref:Tetratricopeptide repeat-containing protein n=2 Tax=Fodinibius sediminis TaxID=1214077 RepID=A0A521ABU8_9BACT|nr:Tetratricopeptide repeat-containing protein [Fodinibius sediminis]
MASSIEDARKANEAYENGDYKKAITLFRKAIDDDPDNAKLFFNLASAQAKAGEQEAAIRTFEQFKSMTENPQRRAMADYNIGNILAKSKQWDQAVEYYKKSLRYLSNDEDAKHNFELAQRKKKEQQQKKNNENKNNQNQKQQQQQQQQNKNQQNQKQQNQQQNQDQKQQQKQNSQDSQNQNQRGQQEQQNQQQQQPQQSKISKADAEKILKALEQKEKDLLKEFKKQKMKSSKNTNEKDW